MKQIRKALILAAGKGTRLWPISASTPKPLLEIKGTPIIEIMINTLIGKGIDEIYIVVGYRKEKFKYLKDKYREVKLIFNKDYENSNTATAIYEARKYLNDDFIILDGDLYIGDRNIINTQISNSKYLYRPLELQNDQWGLHLDFLTNKVLEVRKPEQTTFLNNKIYGISYWLKEDLLKLVNEIVINYKIKKYKNLNYDLVINEIMNEIDLGVEEIEDKKVFEMKVLSDLLEIDESYIMFKSLDLLDKVLNIKKESITDIYDSPGRSLNNRNYVVEVSSDKYLLRIPGKGTELFNDRQAEKYAYIQLKDKNLVEEAYFIDPISGIKISKFYDNSRIVDANNNIELKTMLRKLKKLHDGQYTFNKDDVFDRIRRYDSFVASVSGRKHYTNVFKSLLEDVLFKEKELQQIFEIKPIHADLSPNNVLVTKDNEIIFIDLEFISMGDPYTDIANFAHDCIYTPKRTIELLELYLERESTNKEKFKILFISSAISVMWYIWAVYKMCVEEANFKMYKGYRDQYLNWALQMYEASKMYE